MTRLAWVLFAGVMAAIAGVIVSGFAHAAATAAGTCRLDRQGLRAGHGRAGAGHPDHHYDYWGYYNITFLGSEVRHPEKTIPRAILISVALFVAAFYVS